MVKAIIFDCFGVLYTNHGVNDELFGWISSHAEYVYGIISNAGEGQVAALIGKERAALFGVIIESGAALISKPDSRIYELAAAQLGMHPEECIFVDDQVGYTTAAREVGMQGVTFTDSRRFEQDIAKILENN